MENCLKTLTTLTLTGMITRMNINKKNLEKKIALIEKRQANCARELVTRDIQAMIDRGKKNGKRT